MYINDLTNQVDSCEMSLYADASKLFREATSVTNCQLVQNGLDNVVRWCEAWHLKLNVGKCKYFSQTKINLFPVTILL